jgi:hypothetical protein
MKRTNSKDPRNVQTSPALREIRLQALIFGGAPALTTLATFEGSGPKLPIGLGE